MFLSGKTFRSRLTVPALSLSRPLSLSDRWMLPRVFLVSQGDCTKAKNELGWVPEITFKELVKDMMQSDIAHVDAGNDHL